MMEDDDDVMVAGMDKRTRITGGSRYGIATALELSSSYDIFGVE
jgi:hypothetical protein